VGPSAATSGIASGATLAPRRWRMRRGAKRPTGTLYSRSYSDSSSGAYAVRARRYAQRTYRITTAFSILHSQFKDALPEYRSLSESLMPLGDSR